jgi:uncharacterized protein YbjT (DUF2867 family)
MTKPSLTLITGGTGKTGRRVASRLIDRGRPVRIGTRHADLPFDWDDERTWAPALAGVTAAYVTYYPDLAFPGAPDRVAAFADLAVAAGVEHLVLLSGRNEPEAQRGERLVMDAGAAWTIVRSSFFAQNFSEHFLAEDVLNGEIVFPAGTVAEPFIDVEDIAAVVAAAFTDPRHRGQLYEVTGPRLLTFAAVAAELSRATGRDIRYVPVSADEYAARLMAAGLPADDVAGLTELFTAVLDGRNASLADGVQRALGRPPRDFSTYARDAAAAGAWAAAPVQ